ncbi:hypothetical protein FOMA001_g9020 [Fusarium oxysporum f. sp. matthiolae]|nr:hypothetical protein FOMA001_g9020 [Fusarium oxysporum f. sp. matthiolae]
MLIKQVLESEYCEAVQCLVVRTNKKAATEVYSPNDRETCTVIGIGNAAGETTPPWLIFKAFPTLEWANIEGDLEMRFAQSDTAFSNGDITLEWARDFNRKSWDKSAAVQHRQLDFEEWFGCNEHLKSPSNAAASYDKPPGTEGKAEEDLVWRLLVIDGFSGHGSFAFREYCIKFNILVAFLLPHSTHMLQPMDLGVFQWLKNAHQKRLRDALRKGNLSFNRRDFAGSFKEDFFTIDTQLAPEAREAIRKARFADKPLSSADLSRLLCSDDTVDFTLTQPPADEDEDEDIDLSDEDDLEMPSSPPCLPDRESPLPTIPSTPCPPQRHARYDDAFISRMIEEAEALEATQALYDEQ